MRLLAKRLCLFRVLWPRREEFERLRKDFPAQLPPPQYLQIMRSLSLLEGIAKRADPAFSLMEEAYPYVLERMLMDNSDDMKQALRYIVYGPGTVFDARRFVSVRARAALRPHFLAFSCIPAQLAPAPTRVRDDGLALCSARR